MPTDNVTYNLVTILENKMKGLAAYEKYKGDFKNNQAMRDLLDEIQHDDEQHVEKLERQLAEVLQGRSQQPAGAR